MAIVKLLKGGLLATPAELGERLKLVDADYVDLEINDGAMTARPVAVADRKEAWRRIREAQASVRYIGPEPRPSPEEEERWIFDVLADDDEQHV